MRVVKPTAYIGPVGSLVPFLGPSTETVSGGREVSFSNTLGGRKAFMSPIRSREWSCELDTRYPEELSGLRHIADYGNPPFVWYPADALFGNILTPGQGSLAPGSHDGLDGPMVAVGPGLHVKSVFSDGNYFGFPYRKGSIDAIPVVPGVPVTISVWVRGGVTNEVNVFWRDAEGATTGGSVPSGDLGVESDWVRRSVTVVPPAGVAQMSIIFHGGQVAGPAVTLTDVLLPYSPGKGAKRVVVHGLSETIKLVTQYPGARDLSGLSFTVSEVG